MAEELKPWRCKNDHILGQVKRNGNGVRQLLLYRQAVDLESERMEGVDVMAVVEGFVLDVRCSICGSPRTWMPGQEALEHLIEQSRRMGRVGPSEPDQEALARLRPGERKTGQH